MCQSAIKSSESGSSSAHGIDSADGDEWDLLSPSTPPKTPAVHGEEPPAAVEGDLSRDVRMIICVSACSDGGDSPSTVAIGGVVKAAESLPTGKIKTYVCASVRNVIVHCKQ